MHRAENKEGKRWQLELAFREEKAIRLQIKTRKMVTKSLNRIED